MPVVYRMGDIYCLPSKGETWGLAVNEAMACGRTVLLSNRCGCSVDLVMNGKNGFVFDSGNKKDLIDKMKILLDPKLDIRSMGQSSANLIRSWSFDQVVPAIEQLLQNKTA